VKNCWVIHSHRLLRNQIGNKNLMWQTDMVVNWSNQTDLKLNRLRGTLTQCWRPMLIKDPQVSIFNSRIVTSWTARSIRTTHTLLTPLSQIAWIKDLTPNSDRIIQWLIHLIHHNNCNKRLMIKMSIIVTLPFRAPEKWDFYQGKYFRPQTKGSERTNGKAIGIISNHKWLSADLNNIAIRPRR